MHEVENIALKDQSSPLLGERLLDVFRSDKDYILKRDRPESPKRHRIMLFFKDYGRFELFALTDGATQNQILKALKCKSEQILEPIRQLLRELGYHEICLSNNSQAPGEGKVYEVCWMANAVMLNADNSTIDILAEKSDELNLVYADLLVNLKAKRKKITEILIQLRDKLNISTNKLWAKARDFHGKPDPGLWFKSKINLPNVSLKTVYKKHVSCAVIDDGFNLCHVDLRSKSILDDGISFFSFKPQDRYLPRNYRQDFHGTACVSLIAGNLTGVAPNTEILPLVIDNDEMSFFKALEYASESLVDVISCSYEITNFNWVLTDYGYGEIFRKAIFRRVTDKIYALGIFFVCAAGNSGPVLQAPNHSPSPIVKGASGFPGSVFSVGGTNENDIVWGNSGYGQIIWALQNDVFDYNDYPENAVLNKPDITAPCIQLKVCEPKSIGYVNSFTGTSAAAPLVAGTIALILEKVKNTGVRFSYELVLRAILESTDECVGEPIAKGAGRLNVGKALSKYDELLKKEN